MQLSLIKNLLTLSLSHYIIYDRAGFLSNISGLLTIIGLIGAYITKTMAENITSHLLAYVGSICNS